MDRMHYIFSLSAGSNFSYKQLLIMRQPVKMLSSQRKCKSVQTMKLAKLKGMISKLRDAMILKTPHVRSKTEIADE